MTVDNPFHEGELAAQRRANVLDTAQKRSRMVSDRIPAAALGFIAEQPIVVAGSIGGDTIWASILCGMPGFLKASDDRTLVLDVSQSRSGLDDPLWENIKRNPSVGLLLIDFHSRRRLRINGRMHRATEHIYMVQVEAAYPNCPKYIQQRLWKKRGDNFASAAIAARGGSELEPSQMAWISQADTLFVASAHPQHGTDASHRGGLPGFVQVLDSHTLRIPDYPGNNMFNTLGNLLSYPQAGVAFIDFNRGRVLQLSGATEIFWEDSHPRESAQRYWQLQVHSWRESVLPCELEWEFVEYSPFNPASQ